jgi:hypothetical protein
VIVTVTVTAFDCPIELHREGGKGRVLCYVRPVTHTLSPETVQEAGQGRAVLNSTVQCSAVQLLAIQCWTKQCSAVLLTTALHSAVEHGRAQNIAAQYSSLQCESTVEINI